MWMCTSRNKAIHSIDPASEFYITIYGSIAQSESENISANVKWGKAQSAKQGDRAVPMQALPRLHEKRRR